jgi:hypothetical protein
MTRYKKKNYNEQEASGGGGCTKTSQLSSYNLQAPVYDILLNFVEGQLF